MKKRCSWCEGDSLYEQYHDTEWGVPIHDDQQLFETLTLECFQAGLSWITILRKREHFRKAFWNFDIEKVARLTEKQILKLLGNEGIVRHRKKIEAARSNARLFQEIQAEKGSFDSYLWQFADRKRTRSLTKGQTSLPTTSPEAIGLSKDLKKRGFLFVGPSICYAYMQAVGLVDDHAPDCFKFKGR